MREIFFGMTLRVRPDGQVDTVTVQDEDDHVVHLEFRAQAALLDALRAVAAAWDAQEDERTDALREEEEEAVEYAAAYRSEVLGTYRAQQGF